MKAVMCPQCGAALKPVSMGDLQDKFLACDKCGYQVDVPDEYVLEEAEEFAPYHDADGNLIAGRRRQKRISRRDIPLGDSQRATIGEMLGIPLPDDMAAAGLDSQNYDEVIAYIRKFMGDEVAKYAEMALREGTASSDETAKVFHSMTSDTSTPWDTQNTAGGRKLDRREIVITVAVILVVVTAFLAAMFGFIFGGQF